MLPLEHDDDIGMKDPGKYTPAESMSTWGLLAVLDGAAHFETP